MSGEHRKLEMQELDPGQSTGCRVIKSPGKEDKAEKYFGQRRLQRGRKGEKGEGEGRLSQSVAGLPDPARR